MKNTFLLLQLLLLFSCSTPKQYVLNDNTCNALMPITEKEKNFDITKYDSILSSEGGINIIEDSVNEIRITKYPKGYDFLYGYKRTNKQTNISKWIDYYPSGSIYNLQIFYKKGFEPIGQETHYDHNGNIIKTIDHRQADKYPICFKEAIAIVEKKISKKDSIFSISRDSVLYNKKRYYWSVFVKEPNPKNSNREGKSWSYRIDAATGKLIKKVPVESNPG